MKKLLTLFAAVLVMSSMMTAQEPSIAPIGGKFIISAKGDTAVFSRGNLQYNYGADQWNCAERQYDFLGETANLQFGKEGYTGSIDLFGWSSSDSNYGRRLSNNDADYMNNTFVDWGGLFAGDARTWSTFSTTQMNYVIAHQKWTTLVLDPTPDTDEDGDEIRGLVLFPYDWTTMPAGYEHITYSLYDWWDEAGFRNNTIDPYGWDAFEAAGAVFLPMAGARAGYWGCTWNGDHENTNPAAWNPAADNSFDHVDNIGWYGYYWLSTPDSRTTHQHCANYLIFLGWGEGPTTADDDDVYYPPVVWSREKRRGNSVRLVNIIPRQYTVTYTAGEGTGVVPTDANKYLDGAAITLADASGLSKEGYRFAGWKFKGVTYNDTYTVNNVLRDEAIIFEAQWEELDWQTVRSGLSAGHYYTICYDKEMQAIRGASLWSFNNRDANFAYLVSADAPYEAGKPYILYAESDKLEAVVVGDATLTAGSNGALHGTFSAMNQGNLEDAAPAGHDVYLVIGDELRRATGYDLDGITPLTGNSLPAQRAYVIVDEIPTTTYTPAPGKKYRSMALPRQTPTGFENAEASDKPMKVLINGQLYILRGEKMYNVNGQVVK